MKNSKVVMVTGGAGFVGSHLVEKLLKENYEVHVFDYIPLEKAMLLHGVKENPRFHYFLGDIRVKESIEKFYRPEAVAIYHLASIVGIKHYLERPLDLIDIVVIGTRYLLELAQKHNTHFVFTSTSEVYGKNPKIPWDEKDDRVLGSPAVDRWCYSSSKAVCEHMIHGVQKQSNLPFTIVRFFNVYGPGQNPILVVSQSISRALRGENPLCYDDGKQTRCFTFINDVTDAMLRIIQNPKAIGETFNLGNSTETTIREVVETIVKNVNPKLKIDHFETKKEYGDVYEDIIRRVPSVSKAKEVLGWQATTSLENGIIQTIEWSRKNDWWLSSAR